MYGIYTPGTRFPFGMALDFKSPGGVAKAETREHAQQAFFCPRTSYMLVHSPGARTSNMKEKLLKARRKKST